MALQNWKEILGWSDEAVGDLRFIAYAYIKQGVYDVALNFFEGLLILSRENVYDLQTIGGLHLQLGNGQKALDYLDRALQLDPNHLPTQINRTRALFLVGKKRQGLASAIELEKNLDPTISAQASALILAYH